MTVSHIMAAMMAGGSATMMTNPLWVVKTRFMVSDSCCFCFSPERTRNMGLRGEAVPTVPFFSGCRPTSDLSPGVLRSITLISECCMLTHTSQAQAGLPPDAARYSSTVNAIATIYRTEGFRAFYKGLLPSLLGVSHVAVQFPLYEKAKSWARTSSHTVFSNWSQLLMYH